MSQTIRDVIEMLKESGVELDDKAAAAAQKKFKGLIFASPESVLKDGEVAVNEEAFGKTKSDMMRYKKENAKASQRIDELEQELETSASEIKKERDELKDEVTRYKPIAETFLTDRRKRWDDVSGKIPEDLKEFYDFAEEGKSLSDDQVLSNLEKLREHKKLGAIKLDSTRDDTRETPRRRPAGGKPGGSDESWRDKPPDERMLEGYGDVRVKHGETRKVVGTGKEDED